ncbi:MAG: twin transmembrane helix small protein [Pseudomonadota bacterium]
MLKVVIVILLIAVVISLMSGLVFLFKDTDRTDSKRTLYALGTRVTLAAALLLTIFYGLYTGQLRMGTNAPWHTENRHETGFQRQGAVQAPAKEAPEPTPQ